MIALFSTIVYAKFKEIQIFNSSIFLKKKQSVQSDKIFHLKTVFLKCDEELIQFITNPIHAFDKMKQNCTVLLQAAKGLYLPVELAKHLM